MNDAATLNASNASKELVSDWLLIDQAMVTGFGELTLDPDPMHIDPEWAKANGPYGGTIAYGFLTISLLSYLIHTVREEKPDSKNQGHYLNYGFDKIRLISPIPTGSRIRGRFVSSAPKEDEKGRLLNRYDCTVEIEGQERPALVAEWLSMWMPKSA
jgi:acyl dehydratase